jgi:hypothetical protein
MKLLTNSAAQAGEFLIPQQMQGRYDVNADRSRSARRRREYGSAALGFKRIEPIVPKEKCSSCCFARRISGIRNEACYARHLLGTMAPHELPRNTAGCESWTQDSYEIYFEYYKATFF